MTPSDPHKVLEVLEPLLNISGGLEGVESAKRFAGYLKEADRLVHRCLYVQVLKETDSDILTGLIADGLWDTLNGWLQEAKDTDNSPFLIELFKLYKVLPVTVDMLRKNKSAKTIKLFIKSDNSELKELSSEIVDSWMKKIREKSDVAASDVPKSKATVSRKRHSNPESEVVNEGEGNPSNEKKKRKHDHQSPRDPHTTKASATTSSLSKSDSSKSSSEPSDPAVVSHDQDRGPIKLIISKGQVHTSPVSEQKDEARRVKTVKVRPQRFRDTGLHEDITIPPKMKSTLSEKLSLPRKSSHVPRPETSRDVGEKSPYLITSSPSLPTSTSAANSAAEIHGKIHIIPAKPLKVEIKESSGFIDALTASPAVMVKKKRRPSSRSTTIPLLTVATTTVTTTVASSTASLVTSVATTTMSSVKQTHVPSFYRDTLGSNDGDDSTRSPSPPHLVQQPPIPEYEPTPAIENESITADENIKISTEKKNRKSVSWAADHVLEMFFYFEMDETERENVNRKRDFNEMKKYEAQIERKAMQSAKRLINDQMSEELSWYSPHPVDDITLLIDPGSGSLEKSIQQQRESQVLQALFFSKNMLPDSPAEADVEHYEPLEPPLIPLEDENGGTEVHQFSYNNTEVNSVPSDMQPLPNVPNQPVNPMPPNMHSVPGGMMPNNLGLMPNIQGMIPNNNQGMIPNTNQGMIPNNNQGMVPNNQGMMPSQPPMMTPGGMHPHMASTPLPPDVMNFLQSIIQEKIDFQNPAIANNLQLLLSILNSEQPPTDDKTRHILQILEPYRQQIYGLLNQNQMFPMGQPPLKNVYQPMVGPMQPPFNRMMGPRHQMFPNMNEDNWPDQRGPHLFNKRVRGPFGNVRGFFRGRGSNSSRGRGNSEKKTICRHINAPGGCRYGDKCQFFHPVTNGPNT